jgi:hypothetical protein
LALLIKPALVYYAYVNILLAFWFYFKMQKRWTILAYATILPVVIFIVSNINKNITGYYHFSAIKTENLWTYITTGFLNMKYGNDSGYVYKKEIRERSEEQGDFKHQYLDSACLCS